MKNLTFLRLFLTTMFVMTTAFFTSCVDDNDDTEAPYLKVSPATLVFDTDGIPIEGSQSSFEISTNRHWTATIVDDVSWVTLSKMEGNGSDKVQVSIPEGITAEAKVLIQMSNKVGVLMTQTVTIRSGNLLPETLIYTETFGTTAPSKSPYPFIDEFTDWVKSGEGSGTVIYSGSGSSIRQSGKLSAGYEGASGSDKLFFGASANLVINKITLNEGQTNLKLTFGGSYSKNTNGVYDNEFKPELFHLYLSADGTNWSNAVTYTTQQADEFWILATANFTLKNPVTELYVKFSADEASVFAIDDPTLKTGQGGQEIDLASSGPEEPATAITIPEIISLMSDVGTVIDASKDRYFEAVVQNNIANGNYTNNNLVLAVKDATTSKNGILLYGELADPAILGVTKGDIVKVTLKKGLAKAQLFSGLYEVTGGKDDVWSTIEKTGGTATINPITINVDQLLDFQNMTVKVAAANPKEKGVWGIAPGTYTFTTGGKDFTVFTKAGAVAFVNQPFKSVAEGGTVTGVVSLYKGVPQIAPQSLDDVAAFKSTDPTIIAADPKSVNFPTAGGTEELNVTGANLGSSTLKVSGLSGILSAAVNGTKITVTAKANTKNTEDSQVMKISIDGGNEVEVPVKVAAKPTGNETIIRLDLTTVDIYPSGFPSSAAEKIVDATSYIFNGYTYTFAGSAGNGFYRSTYSSTYYLMVGKQGAYIELPAIANKKLTKVVATTRKDASKKVTVSIVNTSNAAVTGGEEQLWAQTDNQLEYTYQLTGTENDTKYRIYVGNGNNTQFVNWELTYE